jgi:hypothetical protein
VKKLLQTFPLDVFKMMKVELQKIGDLFNGRQKITVFDGVAIEVTDDMGSYYFNHLWQVKIYSSMAK